MKLNKRFIEALKKKYAFEINEAEATLELYLSNDNLASIGEHSQLLVEQDLWIEKLTHAQDKLDTLNKFLNKLSEEESNEFNLFKFF